MRTSSLTALAYEIHKNKICDTAPSVITTTKVMENIFNSRSIHLNLYFLLRFQ